MDKKQFSLLMILVIVSGFFGGAVSEYLFMPQVEAQNLKGPGPVSSDTGFFLTNSSNDSRSELFFDSGNPTFVIRDSSLIIRFKVAQEADTSFVEFSDSSGNKRLQIGMFDEPIIRMFDASGNTVFDATASSTAPAVPAMVPISWLILAMILSVLTSSLVNRRGNRMQPL